MDATIPDSALSKEEHYRRLLLPTIDNAHTNHSDAATSNDKTLETEFRTLLPSLPEPRPISEVLTEVRENLTALPNAMLGEVGLDRAFRVPVDYHAAPRVLTSFLSTNSLCSGADGFGGRTGEECDRAQCEGTADVWWRLIYFEDEKETWGGEVE